MWGRGSRVAGREAAIAKNVGSAEAASDEVEGRVFEGGDAG